MLRPVGLFLFLAERSINVHDPQRLSETELTILVSNHLLGKLATSSCYLVDKNCSGKKGDWCLCSNDACEMTGQYGDTSIGKTCLLSLTIYNEA